MNQVVPVQILRGIAALAIVMLHSFLDAEFLSAAHGWGFTTPTWPLGAGVDLFFVISGFVMVMASRKLFGQAGAPRLFWGRRVARIVPIYWLVTAMFLVILRIRPDTLNSAPPDLGEIIKSFLFIPYVKPADGLMQPVFKLGWTLNYEMMFYCLFAVAIILPARQAVLALSLALASLVAIDMALAPAPGALAFWTAPIILEFMLGMWIGYAHLNGVRLSVPVGWFVALAGLALLMLGNVAAVDSTGFGRLQHWGLPCAMIIAGAALLPPSARTPNPVTAALITLGDASYALYLCHPFAIRLLRVGWERSGAVSLGPWAYIACACLTATITALLIHRFFEKPVTRIVQQRLGVSQRPLGDRQAAK
jgi:exopolysaccharide production protein ExoZ